MPPVSANKWLGGSVAWQWGWNFQGGGHYFYAHSAPGGPVTRLADFDGDGKLDVALGLVTFCCSVTVTGHSRRRWC